jgi:hypothetical protein
MHEVIDIAITNLKVKTLKFNLIATDLIVQKNKFYSSFLLSRIQIRKKVNFNYPFKIISSQPVI